MRYYLIILLSSIIFGCTNEPRTITVKEVGYPEETKDFIKFWKGISLKISQGDSISLRNICSDSIWNCMNKRISKEMFLKKCYHIVFDSIFLKDIIDSTKIKYSFYFQLDSTKLKDKEKILKNEGFYYSHQVMINTKKNEYFTMHFMNTIDGYKLQSCDGCCF